MDNKIKYLELDNIFVDNLNVNKFLVKKNKNIININSLNYSNLILNDNDNDHIIITDEENLDINIKLNTTIIGTKYIIKLTKKQNSLKISSINNDNIIGNYIFYNKTYINNIINNKQKSMSIKSNDNNKLFYIPNSKYGLEEGTEFSIQYLNNKWILEGIFIGDLELNLDLNLKTYELILYICLDTNKIIYSITKENTKFYFNKHFENNINLFLNNNYSLIKLINIKTNIELFNSSQTVNTYYIEIKNDGVFEKLQGLDFINNSFTNIVPLYDTITNSYYNINNNNLLEYKILHNQIDIISNVYFNILDINAYNNNNNSNNINLNTLIFDNYKGFILNSNLINELNI